MVTKAQKVRLGVFLATALFLLGSMLAYVIGSKLIESFDTYYIAFQDFSVNGLQVGSEVKYRGISIGRVTSIGFDQNDISRVLVAIDINSGTPVKKDVSAQLILAGITGLKFIELKGGSKESPLLEPGSYIKSELSTIDNISGKAEVLVAKIENLLNNLNALTNEHNQQQVASILTNTSTILEDNRTSVKHIVTNLDSLTWRLSELVASTNRFTTRLEQIAASPDVDSIMVNIRNLTGQLSRAELRQTVAEIRAFTTEANKTITHIDLTFLKGRNDILHTVETLREAVDYLSEFARQISDDPRRILLEQTRQP